MNNSVVPRPPLETHGQVRRHRRPRGRGHRVLKSREGRSISRSGSIDLQRRQAQRAESASKHASLRRASPPSDTSTRRASKAISVQEKIGIVNMYHHDRFVKSAKSQIDTSAPISHTIGRRKRAIAKTMQKTKPRIVDMYEYDQNMRHAVHTAYVAAANKRIDRSVPMPMGLAKRLTYNRDLSTQANHRQHHNTVAQMKNRVSRVIGSLENGMPHLPRTYTQASRARARLIVAAETSERRQRSESLVRGLGGNPLLADVRKKLSDIYSTVYTRPASNLDREFGRDDDGCVLGVADVISEKQTRLVEDQADRNSVVGECGLTKPDGKVENRGEVEIQRKGKGTKKKKMKKKRTKKNVMLQVENMEGKVLMENENVQDYTSVRGQLFSAALQADEAVGSADMNVDGSVDSSEYVNTEMDTGVSPKRNTHTNTADSAGVKTDIHAVSSINTNTDTNPDVDENTNGAQSSNLDEDISAVLGVNMNTGTNAAVNTETNANLDTSMNEGNRAKEDASACAVVKRNLKRDMNANVSTYVYVSAYVSEYVSKMLNGGVNAHVNTYSNSNMRTKISTAVDTNAHASTYMSAYVREDVDAI